MNTRQEEIIFHLTSSKEVTTSAQLSNLLGISVRTIKYEMNQIRVELKDHGAQLISKRNSGYSIIITDPEKFAPFIEAISLKLFLHANERHSKSALLLKLMRKIVASKDYLTLDDLSSRLYVSPGSLRQLLREASDFFESCNLSMTTKSGAGITVYGKEQHFRQAITSLYAYYYHKVKLSDIDDDYALWITCDEKERQDIRHIFLKELRESPVSLQDRLSQWLSIYLIVARNRWVAGKHVTVPNNWKKQIRSCDVHPAALGIFAKLSEHHKGFDVAADEVDFFAIHLLCARDAGHISPDVYHTPFLAEQSKKLGASIFEELERKYGVDFNIFHWTETELSNLIIPMMAKKHFGLDIVLYSDVKRSEHVYNSPLPLMFARTMIEHTEAALGSKLSHADKAKLVGFICKIIAMTEYEIKKQNYLLVSSLGISHAHILRHQLMEKFGHLIESCTCVQLYEIRKLNQELYDGVILDLSDTVYKYDLPAVFLRSARKHKDLVKVFEALVVNAFQFKKHLPNSENITVYNNFEYPDEEGFLQLISYKHSKTASEQQSIMKQLVKSENLLATRAMSGTIVLFAPAEMTGLGIIELYRLEKPADWNGERIESILFVCIKYTNPHQVKIIENCLYVLATKPEAIELLEKDSSQAFEKVLRGYLYQ